jgi:hypothetical protein
MRRASPLAGLVVVALSGALAAPGVAVGSGTYAKVLQAYERTGTIPPCTFSAAELSSALTGLDTYAAQYLGNATSAIETALAARAAGQCSGGPGSPSSAGTAVLGPTATNASHSRPLPVGSVTAATGGALPLPLILLGVLVVLAPLVAVLGAGWSRRGRDPAWAVRSGHAWREIGYRAGGIWSDFVDWLRSA